MGIRVESKSSTFIPYSYSSIDYKLIEKIEKGVEFRTFCCCKDGTVIKSEFDNYISYNGTNTQFVTDTSNIGLLVRATDIKSTYYQEMSNLLKNRHYSFNIPIKIFIENNGILIGEKCDAVLRDKLVKIFNIKKLDINFCHVYGPEIEYIGKYMIFDEDLNISDNIWVAGDVSGNFRGLIAALISGIYSAKNILKKINDSINKNINQLGVKLSSIGNLELIFTAQSKKYFYCRDIICQYVLEREKLPINPFRVFDYFLSDRVNRDIIRRGNNQLIQSCKELWVFGPVADGVLFEIALAKLNGKNIRFFSISTRVDEITEILNLNDVVFEPEVHAKQITKNDLIKFITNNIYDDQFELPLF
jgi:anti-anti-sigma regulatory factor